VRVTEISRKEPGKLNHSENQRKDLQLTREEKENTMKIIKAVAAVLAAGLLIGSNFVSRAQAQTDSVVRVMAEANGLQLVLSDEIPRFGTFWVVTRDGSFLLPLPWLLDDLRSTPVFSLDTAGQFLVDGTGGVLPQPNWRQALRGVTSATLLQAQVSAVQELITRVQKTQSNAKSNVMLGVTDAMNSMDADESNSGGDSEDAGGGPSPDTRRNYAKFQNQIFSLIDTNNVAANDTNLYNALLSFPDDTGTNSTLQIASYGANAVIIKANHFDYSAETDRDFALLVCDKVETPTWKNLIFKEPPMLRTAGLFKA
jgi:hypothetical protein